MPKCSDCGKSYPDKESLVLTRGEDRKWIVRCRACVAAKQKAPAAPNAPALASGEPSSPPATNAEGSGSPENAAAAKGREEATPADSAPASRPPAEPLEELTEPLTLEEAENRQAFQRLREICRDLRLEEEERVPRAYKRAHTRHSADLEVEFIFARDNARHRGRVKDISRAGMRFETSRRLREGQTLFLHVLPRSGESEATPPIRSAAEVRRVIPCDDDFEVGVRFVTHGRVARDNRRRHRRYDVHLPFYYQREGSLVYGAGWILNMSQGGFCATIHETPVLGEALRVRFLTDGHRFSADDVEGDARVVRVTAEGNDCEVGCSFVDIGLNESPDAS